MSSSRESQTQDLLVEFPSGRRSRQSKPSTINPKKQSMRAPKSCLTNCSSINNNSLTRRNTRQERRRQTRRVRFNQNSTLHEYSNPLSGLDKDEIAALFYSEDDKTMFKKSAARTVHELRKILTKLQDSTSDGVERDPNFLLLEFLTQKPNMAQNRLEAGEIIGIEMLLEGKEATSKSVIDRRNTVKRVVYEYHRLHHLRKMAEVNHSCEIDDRVDDEICHFVRSVSRKMTKEARVKALQKALHVEWLNKLEHSMGKVKE